MKNIIGFRQYLKSEKSYADLKEIIEGQSQFFPPQEGFMTLVALCGDNPRDYLEQHQLQDKVAFYPFAPWEESAQRVSEVFKKSIHRGHKVQIIHYDEKPLGLTYPLELLIRIGNLLGSDNVAVSDSDFQMPYNEIRKAYEFHLSVAKRNAAVITYPKRARRSLDAEAYPINRWAMEDLENMYIYMLSDLRALKHKADFQSGLSITSQAANKSLNFDRVGSWIGNLHMAIQVIRNKGRLEKDFIVNTNLQNESTINFNVQCAKIEQLNRYYMIPISNIIHLALQHSDQYLMRDWRASISQDQVREDILKIERMYANYITTSE